MLLSQMLNAVEHELLFGDDVEIAGISIDSRDISQGFLFCAISGLSTDGHGFIEGAIKNGAKSVLCEKPPETFEEGVVYARVADTRAALAPICAQFFGYPDRDLRIYGVTGTNGKTSVTQFLNSIFETAGRKCGVIGTAGAAVGAKDVDIPFATSTTPDTIELFRILRDMADRGVSDVFMEVSSHALALSKVSGMVFEAGIFTNLTQDHLDFHKTFENYMAAKRKLFTQSRVSVVNSDDEHGETMLSAAAGAKVTYGIDKAANFAARNVEHTPHGSTFDLIIFGDIYRFSLSIPGRFMVYNALSAIATAVTAGVSVRMAAEGVSALKGVRGRFEPVPNELGFGVYIDYAHTPDAIANIIKAVREITAGRVITLFGCGGDRDSGKRPIMGKTASELSDLCVITSDNPRNESPDAIIDAIEEGVKSANKPFIRITDRREAIKAALAEAKPGDSVIIAGKGHEDYQEFENKRKERFDDAEEAALALREIEA